MIIRNKRIIALADGKFLNIKSNISKEYLLIF